MSRPDLTRDLARMWRWAGGAALVSGLLLLAMLPGPVRQAVAAADRVWYDWMVDLYLAPVARFTAWFTALGGVWVTVPLRAGVALALAWRRSWARLSLWVAAIAV